MRIERITVFLLLLLTIITSWAGNLVVTAINVGQADSILVQFPAGETMLIDAGGKSDGSTVVQHLKNHGVKQIDILVATHPHEDHIGGMPDVLSEFKIGKVWDSGYSHGSKIQQKFLSMIKDKNIQYGMPRKGFTQDIGDVHIKVLAPGNELLSGTNSDANNNSIVMQLQYKDTSFLLTGDMESEERAACGPWPQSTVLKVAHHGSRNGTDSTFIKAVKPTYAVISYALGNSYGHPHAEAIKVLNNAGIKLYTTANSGNVVFTSDGKKVTVSATPSNVKSGKASSSSTGSTGVVVADTGSGTDTVYITKSGKCYHADGCNSLSRSKIPISRAEAIKKGYTACKRCNP